MSCDATQVLRDACANGFSGLNERDQNVALAELQCEIKDLLTAQAGLGPVVNLAIPFRLVSGDPPAVYPAYIGSDVLYEFATQGIGWYIIAANWIVTSTSGSWTGGIKPRLTFDFFYDVETNTGNTDSFSTVTGQIEPNIPTTNVPQNGILLAQPIYFEHTQAPDFDIAFAVTPGLGEFVQGYIRILLTRQTTT